MAESWPVGVNTNLLQAGFTLQDDPQFIEQSMDVGPPKVRRRSTEAYSSQGCSLYLDETELGLFDTFYNVTLSGGVKYFDFTDQVTSTTRTYRFKSPYKVTPVTGNRYKVDMLWQAQP